MISAGSEFVRRSLKASSGEAACWTTSTASTWKLRLGMRSFFHGGRLGESDGSRLQTVEELTQFLPYFRSPRQALPMHANQTDEFVAFVNGKQIILRGRVSARISQSIREQRFHVRFHSL